MTQNNEETAQDSPVITPDVGSCYGHGWQQMLKYILELLLITIIFILISIPAGGLSAADEFEGPDAFFLVIFSLAYSILIVWPIEYGVDFAFLKAARGEKVDVKDMFEVFQNYLNAVFASLLVAILVGIGIAFCIVPGIIIACKLAFVPYLVVDRKMEAIEAIKESWRMTTGHATTVFLIGLLAIPIFILGLLCCGVGAVGSIMWITLAFASLYHSVRTQEVQVQNDLA